MRILFTADFHIDESKRLEDTKKSLDFIAEFLSKENISYLVILGDIFNKRKPSPIEMRVFNQWVMKICDEVDNIIIIEGNHDLDKNISAVSYLEDLMVEKLTIYRPPVVILDKFYLGHEQIDSAVADNGIPLLGGIILDNIVETNPSCEVFAFGHFHKPQILKKEPLCFYAGSINPRTFSERDDKKCLWLFEDTQLIKQIELPTRKMHQITVDLVENVHNAWDFEPEKGSLIKIIYRGTKVALQSVDEDNVVKYLKSAGAESVFICYDVLDATTSRNENLTESISDATALSEYFKNRDLDSKLKKQVIKTGLEIIKHASS
jgi:DNA repair exonuclease SbcCD nuclease subunit